MAPNDQEMTKGLEHVRARPVADHELESLPLVSVVIAAYNESEHISRCLGTLMNQTYNPLEVVVADDGSTDDTAELVASFPQVKLARLSHRGAGAARNSAARIASGKILVFLDADMSFPPEFIRNLTAPMLERGVVGTFSREILVANANRRWARAHRLGRELPLDSHFPEGFPDRWENFRAVWSEAFWRVGGFDEIGYFEDMTVGRKLGELAEVAPGAVCWHYEPETLRDIVRSAIWVGRGETVRDPANTIPVVHKPHRALKNALRLALKHRSPSLFVYRIVWEGGVMLGLRRGAGIMK